MSSKNAHVGLYLLASTDTLEFMKKVPILASAIKDMTALIICEMTSTVILLGGNPPMPQPPSRHGCVQCFFGETGGVAKDG